MGSALALAAVERGKKVLLVEIDAPLEAARYLGAPAGEEPKTEVLPGLFTRQPSPPARSWTSTCGHVVKVSLLADRVLASPIYDRFLTAAPGLKELMVLGKIMVLEEERASWGRKPKYDLVVVDAARHRPRALDAQGPDRRRQGGARGPGGSERPPHARPPPRPRQAPPS